MCGIWTRATSNRPISLEEILYPVKMLAHRGPDSYGWFAHENIAMVHTRLSIIDLSGGAQPLKSFDNKFLGIVNGELYDHQIHRQRLQEKGVHFKTHSDSEVLLNLFAYYGSEGLRGLSGEWAFIFYNLQQNKLYFARDPHGVKPLFFQKKNGELTLSSEIKALSSEKPILSEDYVKTFMARSLMPKGTSLDQCFHVLPGRVYSYDLQNQNLSWQIIDPLPIGIPRTLRGEDAIEALILL